MLVLSLYTHNEMPFWCPRCSKHYSNEHLSSSTRKLSTIFEFVRSQHFFRSEIRWHFLAKPAQLLTFLNGCTQPRLWCLGRLLIVHSWNSDTFIFTDSWNYGCGGYFSSSLTSCSSDMPTFNNPFHFCSRHNNFRSCSERFWKKRSLF